jgi:hypothetical protein
MKLSLPVPPAQRSRTPGSSGTDYPATLHPVPEAVGRSRASGRSLAFAVLDGTGMSAQLGAMVRRSHRRMRCCSDSCVGRRRLDRHGSFPRRGTNNTGAAELVVINRATLGCGEISVPPSQEFLFPLQGGPALEVVKTNHWRQHVRYLEHVDTRRGHALAQPGAHVGNLLRRAL